MLFFFIVMCYCNYWLLKWINEMEKIEKEEESVNRQPINQIIHPNEGENQISQVIIRERNPSIIESNSNRPIKDKKDKDSKKNEEIKQNREKKKKDIELTDDNKCCVCYANVKEVAFYKCGHEACCFECGTALKNKKCPICRDYITDVFKIFR